MEPYHGDIIQHLTAAISWGSLDNVKYYLEEENVDVNSTNCYGYTPLHEASHHGETEIVNYLISRGAEVNVSCTFQRLPATTPLTRAVSSGHVEVANILIQNGAETDIVVDGRNLLDFAIHSNRREMLSFVASLGFDINRRNDAGWTPLATAMNSKTYESIEFLLEMGADYKQTSESGCFLPIHYPFLRYFCEPIENVELLLKHIEEKEGRKGMADYLNYKDNSKGFTALHEACRNTYYDAVKLFFECGADPNIRDNEGKKPNDLLPEVSKCQYKDDWKKIKELFESYEQQH